MHRLRVKNSVCKQLRSCTVLLVTLSLVGSFAAFAESGSRVSGSSPGLVKAPEPRTREPKQREHSRAQMFSGEGVRLRAHQLRSSNKAMARAMKDFEKRGLEPKWDQSLTVLETTSNSTAAISGRALQRASYP